MGLTLIFMSKRGALKSKYSAVHSDFYCFASADICQHGLLHVATCIAYTIYSLTDVQQWSLNAPLMLRHFSTSGYLWCVHTSIVVHWPTSFDIARCRPSSLSDTTATRLGIAGHRSTSSVDRCTAMKSERTIMVNSDFIDVHRSTSANASRSQQLCALWMFVRIARVVPQKTSVDSSRPMQNDGSLNAP